VSWLDGFQMHVTPLSDMCLDQFHSLLEHAIETEIKPLDVKSIPRYIQVCEKQIFFFFFFEKYSSQRERERERDL
jgi:hypothetical protein